MGSPARLALLAATVLMVVVLFLVLRPDGEDPTRSTATPSETTTSSETETETETETLATTTAETPHARIQARGDGSGSIRRIGIERGQRVTLVVNADVVDKVHVHGYDLMADVAPGSPAPISFEASVPGRFEVELENRAIPIPELRVGS